MTIQDAQDLRKHGYTIVVNSTRSKVLLTTKNEDEAYKLKSECALKNKVVRVYSPLTRMIVTKEDINKALSDLRKGLNCNF